MHAPVAMSGDPNSLTDRRITLPVSEGDSCIRPSGGMVAGRRNRATASIGGVTGIAGGGIGLALQCTGRCIGIGDDAISGGTTRGAADWMSTMGARRLADDFQRVRVIGSAADMAALLKLSDHAVNTAFRFEPDGAGDFRVARGCTMLSVEPQNKIEQFALLCGYADHLAHP